MSLLRRLEEKKGDFALPAAQGQPQPAAAETSAKPVVTDALSKAKERIRNLTIASLNDVKDPTDQLIREKLEELIQTEGSEIPRG